MEENFEDITTLNLDNIGAGRFYISKKIIEKLHFEDGQHFKVIVDNGRIIFERVK